MKIQSITIRDAMSGIVNNDILLPAIQREFVWKREAIELMFDSILRDYPINTMMLWNINNIKQQPLDFYSFLTPQFRYGVSKNTQYNKSAANVGNKLIVIDGQQRLTGLYIGLFGSFSTQKGQPQSLYIRIDSKATSNDRFFDFRFLTINKVNSLMNAGQTWFKMSDLPKTTNIFLKYSSLANNVFAMNLLRKLDSLLDGYDYLNYYDIKGYNTIDDALEVFTRTNNTGTRLTKGDLLLSILTTQWANKKNENARDYVSDIITEVAKIGYKIDRDWLIKCCLVVFSSNIQTTVANFSTSQVADGIFKNRVNFKNSILASFELVRNGFDILEKGLTTKLAIIPIIYFIYKHRLWGTVNKAQKGHNYNANANKQNYRNSIRKWLFRSIVQNLFDASTDDILKKVKLIIEQYSNRTYFPFAEIENQYPEISNANINYTSLLDTPKAQAFPILNIIYSGTSFLNHNYTYDVDHMHPEYQFQKSQISSIVFTTPADENPAKDGITYNCVRNLQLLERGSNRSKNKMPFNKWVQAANNPQQILNCHFIPTTSYDIKDFKTFIDERSKLLENRLKIMLS